MQSSTPPRFKVRAVMGHWVLALALSAILVAAGERWPAPLPVANPLSTALVLGLVLGVPAVVAAGLLRHWRVACPPAGSASDGLVGGHGGESSD